MDPRGEEWSARLPSPHLIARSGPGCGAAVAVCVGRFLPAECGAGDAQLVVALADRINVYQGDPRGAGEGSAAVLVLSQATLGRVVEVARLKWNECHQGTVAQEHVGLDFLALLAESGHLSILSYSRTLARLLAVQRIDLGSPQSRRHLGSGPLRRRIVPHPDGTAFATAAAHDRVAIFPARALAAEPSAVGTPPGPFAEEHRAIYAPAARRDPGAPTVAANAGLAGTPAPPMPVPAFHPTGADGISAVNVLRLLGSGVGEHSPLESSLPSDRAEPQWTVLAAAFVDAGAAAGAGLAVVALLYVAVTRRFVGRLLRRGAGQTALEAAGSAELGGAVGTAMDLVALEGVCRGGVLCCGTEGVVVLHVTQRGLEVMQTLPWASFFGPLAPPPACEALAHTGTLHVSAACRLPRTGGAAAEDAEDYACALSNGTLWAVRVAAGTAAVPWRTKGLGQVVRLPADATRNVGATTGLVALPAGSDWRGGAPFVLLRDPGEVVSGEFLYITPPETATSAQRAGATHWQFVAQSIVAGALAGATDMVLADGGERGGTLAYVTCAGGGVGEGGGSLRSIAAAQEAGDAVTLATGLNFLTGLFALSAQASNAVVGVAFPDVTKVLAVTTSATPSGTQAIVQDATPRLRSGPLPAPCLLAASVGPTEWGVSAFVGPESAALVRTAGTGEDGAVEVRFAERISCAALEAATGTLVLVRQGRTLAVTPLLAAARALADGATHAAPTAAVSSDGIQASGEITCLCCAAADDRGTLLVAAGTHAPSVDVFVGHAPPSDASHARARPHGLRLLTKIDLGHPSWALHASNAVGAGPAPASQDASRRPSFGTAQGDDALRKGLACLGAAWEPNGSTRSAAPESVLLLRDRGHARGSSGGTRSLIVGLRDGRVEAHSLSLPPERGGGVAVALSKTWWCGTTPVSLVRDGDGAVALGSHATRVSPPLAPGAPPGVQPVILPASIGASPYALVGGLSDALSRDERFDVVLIAATTAGDLVACGLPFRGACGARSMTFGRGVPWCLAECPNVHAIVVASRPDPDEPTLLAPSPPGIDRHNIKSHPIQGTPLASADEDMAEPAVEEAANELHRSEVGIDEPFVDPSRGSPPSPTGTLTPGRMGYHYHGYGGDRAMPWAPDVFGLDGEEPRRPDPAAWPVRAQVTMGHKRVTRQTSRPRRLIESIYTPEAKGTVTLLCPRTAAELCTLNLMAGECPTAVARFASPAQPDADAAAHDAPSDILVVGTSFSQDDLRRKPFQGVIGALGRLLLLRVSRDGAESQVGAIELLDCVLVPGRVLALAHGPMLPGRTKSWALETWGVMHAAIGRRVVTMWLGQGRDRLCVMRQEPTMQPFACLAASPTGHLARGSRQGVVSLGQPMPLGHDDADRPPSPRARERCRHWGFVPAGVVDVLVEGRGGRLLTIADGAGVLVTMSPAAGRWCCLESLAEAARRGSEGAADGSGGIAAGSGVGGAAESSMGAARASTELRNGHAVPLPERGVAKLELSDFAAAALRGTWEAAHPIPGARPSVAAKGMTAPLLTVADMDGMGVAAAASFHEQLQVLQAVRAALRASTCATTPVDAAARRSGQFGARATGAEASETATEASGDAAQGPGVAVDARVAPTAPGHGHLVPDAAVPLQGKPLRLCGGVLAQRQPRATPHATEDATPAHRHGITALCAGGQLRSLHVLTPGEYVCLRALEVAAAEHRALAPLSGGPRSTLPGPLPSRLAHAASQGGVEWSLAKLTSGGSFGVVDGDLLGEAAKLPSHEQLHICASAVRVLLGDGGGAEGGSSSSATAGDAPPLAGTMLRALHLMTSSTA